jgi:serine/threonine protein kinase
MDSLQVTAAGLSATKQKAVEDAAHMQATIIQQCTKNGRRPPPYTLAELIGKGSFGRVYKATRTESSEVVAVKMICIDESDRVNPTVDTVKEILKEVETLKLLSNRGAENINAVIDTLLVGPSMWIVTEYCAGGSVATLMRPTNGLQEKWIVPILREVAEAIFWVHKNGIIHRDIKCANVLVTETGSIQLCDFGVAGIIETRFDRRKTVTGTLQWMAPELFDATVSYGTEVDVWAFGSMAYEVATGLPPNATTINDITQFGSYLKENCPRLDGDQFSSGLKELVAYCLVQDPARRPSIEQVQQHDYIYNTADEYPTESLKELISAYRAWEAKGGIRKSLFTAGGAHAPRKEEHKPMDDWNFNLQDDIDPLLGSSWGQSTDEGTHASSSSQDTTSSQSRRRRGPVNSKPITSPLLKLFDPNTLSDYWNSSVALYSGQTSPSANDMSFRNTSEDTTARESLIDSDASSAYSDEEQDKVNESLISVSHDEPDRGRRLSRDWTFPMMRPASRSLERRQSRAALDDMGSAFGKPSAELYQRVHGRPLGLTVPVKPRNRDSTNSLIDLDVPDDIVDTEDSLGADLDDALGISDIPYSTFPRERNLTGHRSQHSSGRLPSLYISDSASPSPTEIDDFATSPVGSLASPEIEFKDSFGTGSSDGQSYKLVSGPRETKALISPLPPPPSPSVIEGTSTKDELRDELKRVVASFAEHLQAARRSMTPRPKQDV